MRSTTKLPKTFSIYVNDGELGFLRFISSQNPSGTITYSATYEKLQSNATKFLNVDTVKNLALRLCEKNGFKDVIIVDDQTKKVIHVKQGQ